MNVFILQCIILLWCSSSTTKSTTLKQIQAHAAMMKCSQCKMLSNKPQQDRTYQNRWREEEDKKLLARWKVLTAALMKIQVLWDIMTCKLVNRFWKSSLPSHSGYKNSWAPLILKIESSQLL